MKDYRTWWQKGWDVCETLMACDIDEWNIDDGDYFHAAEQIWAIREGLA